MKVKNHKLYVGNSAVDFSHTKNQGGTMPNGVPDTVVIHYTAGGSASGSIAWFKNNTSGVSAHLVIDRNGHITQMVPFNKIAWHAGTSRWRGKTGLNKYAVGIELANWGKLNQKADGSWSSRTGKTVPSNDVVLDAHKHSSSITSGWEQFPQAQMDACIAASAAITQEYGIKPWDFVGHDDIAPRRKIDPGPALGMDELRASVFGMASDSWDDNLYAVESPSGLNLRSGPGVANAVLKNLPDQTIVHVIEKLGNWWMIAEVVQGDDDVTGYVHSNWLNPLGSAADKNL